MIGLHNADSSFFDINIDDVKVTKQAINDDVISLSIIEEVGKAASGTLQLYDPNLEYPSLLRMGMKLSITWGYKSADTSIEVLQAVKENSQEMQGSFQREGMTAYIMSPSGNGNSKGLSIYNCNFYGTEWSKTENRKVYGTGRSKYDVIVELFGNLKIVAYDIAFTRGSELITDDTQLLQWESDFRFLQRCARDWKCVFRVGYTPSGTLYGMFIDHDKFDLVQFNKITTGASFGNSIQLDWKWGLANVKEYSWQNHAGESGSGDHVNIQWINGKPTFIRYIAENETVRAYRFVPSKVTEELKRRGNTGGIASQTEYLKWATAQIDFNSMRELVTKGYFVPVDESTSPQGLGYSVNVKMLGNPLITPPIYAKFGEGFPHSLASSQFKMFMRKVEHVIDKTGYKINAEIVDTLTATGGSFVY